MLSNRERLALLRERQAKEREAAQAAVAVSEPPKPPKAPKPKKEPPREAVEPPKAEKPPTPPQPKKQKQKKPDLARLPVGSTFDMRYVDNCKWVGVMTIPGCPEFRTEGSGLFPSCRRLDWMYRNWLRDHGQPDVATEPPKE